MGIMALAGIALVVALIYMLLRGSSLSESRGDHEPAGYRETPLEIVRRRYAAGEITQEDFHRIMKDLG